MTCAPIIEVNQELSIGHLSCQRTYRGFGALNVVQAQWVVTSQNLTETNNNVRINRTPFPRV